MLSVMILQGCYNIKVVSTDNQQVGQIYTEYKFYALFGLIPYEENTSPCKNKSIISVETKTPFLSLLINSTPLGLILASNSVKTVCAA